MENNTAVIIAIVSAIATLVGGGYAAWVQLKRDKAAGNVELLRLQDEMETKLWTRYSADFDKLSARLDHQDEIIKQQSITIQEQGATIQQQGALLLQHRERIKALEEENGILKAENDRLKGKTRGNRV